MASLEYDSRANKPGRRRADAQAESPRPGGNPPEQPLALVPPPLPLARYAGAGGPQAAGGRLQVVDTLTALAGPPARQPLVYTGDVNAGLAALRQDIAASYSMLCGALGEPERMDLVTGSLPAAAALGINLPSSKLPSIYGPSGSPPPAVPPLLLEGAARRSSSGSLALQREGGEGGVAAGLGPAIGIEGVGSGASGPAKLLGAGAGAHAGAAGISASGAGPISPYALQNFAGLAHMGSRGAGALPYQPAPAASGLPPLPAPGTSQQQWPSPRAVAGGPRIAGGGSGGPADGPRVGALTGFSRPKDPDSEFLGEESALVFPPPGRSFGGGPNPTGAGMGGLAIGGLIDPMDDLRYRAAARKHAFVEQLDSVSNVAWKHAGDAQDLDRFLQDYARDRSKPGNGRAAEGSSNRYRMPF